GPVLHAGSGWLNARRRWTRSAGFIGFLAMKSRIDRRRHRLYVQAATQETIDRPRRVRGKNEPVKQNVALSRNLSALSLSRKHPHIAINLAGEQNSHVPG